MTLPYDLGSLNASTTTSFLDVITSINQNSDYALGVFLLLTVFIGYYVLFKKEERVVDLLTSSFLTAIVATLFLVIGWIGWTIYIVVLFIFFIMFILYFIIG